MKWTHISLLSSKGEIQQLEMNLNGAAILVDSEYHTAATGPGSLKTVKLKPRLSQILSMVSLSQNK